jgi:putative transcriptional regulator
MTGDFALTNLTHHFLIAMPGLEDGLFSKSVVYLCEHGPRGALGLIINKPADIKMAALFDKVDLQLQRQDLVAQDVFQGGPLHEERGFVLHEPVFSDHPRPKSVLYSSTMVIPGGLEMTTSRDVLEAIASGAGPRKVLVSLGYSSWGEGQLENEIKDNSWLTVDAKNSIIFDTPVAQRYDKALALLGLQAWMISPHAGSA